MHFIFTGDDNSRMNRANMLHVRNENNQENIVTNLIDIFWYWSFMVEISSNNKNSNSSLINFSKKKKRKFVLHFLIHSHGCASLFFSLYSHMKLCWLLIFGCWSNEFLESILRYYKNKLNANDCQRQNLLKSKVLSNERNLLVLTIYSFEFLEWCQFYFSCSNFFFFYLLISTRKMCFFSANFSLTVCWIIMILMAQQETLIARPKTMLYTIFYRW